MAVRRSINYAQRFGVWKAAKGLCFWCREPVQFQMCHIDHVIPLDAISHDQDRTRIIVLYGLDPGFDFDSYYNWVPAHNSCNQQKSFKSPDPAPIFSTYMQTVRGRAPTAKLIAETIEKDTKNSPLHAKIGTAISNGDISHTDLESYLKMAVERSIQSEHNTDIGVVADLTTATAISNEQGTNCLQQALNTLGADDVDIRRRILGSSVWLYPLPITKGVSLLKEKGYDEPAISSNLDRLKHLGFVHVTSAHILPQDRQVCQEAADILADEFIDLLRAL